MVLYDEMEKAHRAVVTRVNKRTVKLAFSIGSVRIDIEKYAVWIVPSVRVSPAYQAVLPALGTPPTTDRSRRCVCGQCLPDCCVVVDETPCGSQEVA